MKSAAVAPLATTPATVVAAPFAIAPAIHTVTQISSTLGPLTEQITREGYNIDAVLSCMLEGYSPIETIEGIAYSFKTLKEIESEVSNPDTPLISDPNHIAERLISAFHRTRDGDEEDVFSRQKVSEFLSRERVLATNLWNATSQEDEINPARTLTLLFNTEEESYINQACKAAQLAPADATLPQLFRTIESHSLELMKPLFQKAWKENPEAMAKAIAERFTFWNNEDFIPKLHAMLGEDATLASTNAASEFSHTITAQIKTAQENLKLRTSLDFEIHPVPGLSDATHSTHVLVPRGGSLEILKRHVTKRLGLSEDAWIAPSVCRLNKESPEMDQLLRMACNYTPGSPTHQVSENEPHGKIAGHANAALGFGV